MKNTNFRDELKYVISSAQLVVLKNRILGLMQPDPHVGQDGVYNIRSLYFDNYNNQYYYENENGTDPREKFRIRIYNHSVKRITLECKQKVRGKTHKISCPLTLEQTQKIIQREPMNIQPDDHPLLKRFLIEIKTKMLRPVVIVEYDRIPFVYKNGNVRVTFDTNISSSSDIKNFLSEKIAKRPIMPRGQQLMEVKFDELLPDAIYHNLNLKGLQQTAFSKYYLCRKFSLFK